LSEQRVAAIFTSGGVDAVHAAKTAAPTLPIIFVNGSDPVRAGLVQSLARPGGNITGVTFVTGEIQAKSFELLRDALPGATKVAALVNPHSATGEARHVDIVHAARAFGIELAVVNAAISDEFGAAFAWSKQRGDQAVFVVADPVFRNRMESIVSHAHQFSLPLMGFSREFAEAGAFLSYGADISTSFREAGIYVGRVLRGEKPSDLPVLQPIKFELVLNVKSAKSHGIEFSPKLLARADEVIE
jgi:putative tryptophan/tyrosine transport system substrate-binding protein